MMQDRSRLAHTMTRAATLAPVLRERVVLGENLRRPSHETADDGTASKLLRLCEPARFG